MSNSLAIAAVTATLQKLIETEIQLEDGSSKVTTRPPDKVADATNQLNLFLYHAEVNAAWRNAPERSGRLRPGESGQPALPLNLFYLLTAYGRESAQGDDAGQRLLGRAMRVLHDHALLGAAEIENALPEAELHRQVEPVRITYHPLSLDDMNKIWSACQSNYRLSVAYQVAVVLIDSQRPPRAPLPVLTIGQDDRGVIAQPSLIPPYPALTAITLPANQASAQPGDSITLAGHHLAGDSVELRLAHPLLASPATLASAAFTSASSEAIRFVWPDTGTAPRDLPAGTYQVTVAVTTGGQVRTTNALPLALAPRIDALNPAATMAGDFTLTVTCLPQVRPVQRLRLLFGASGAELAPQPFAVPASPSAASTLNFDLVDVPPGLHAVRLRVDGIDSILIRTTGTPPLPQFDPAQQVTVA